MILPSLIRALSEYSSATVSGFGIFFVKHVPSQIKEGIVYPPHNIVEFQYSKDVEDFNFVNRLSQWEQIRIDEAQARISEWVNLIEKGLEYNKSVFFDDFGTFLKDSDDKIVFQSMLISQFNIENEGFEPVIIPVNHSLDTPQDLTKPATDKRINKKKEEKNTIKYCSSPYFLLPLRYYLFCF